MNFFFFCCRSVIYKEQVRLNQAATNALMARLEAQRAICDNAEKELHRKYRQRDEIEKQIRPEWDQGRKRIRMDDFAYDDEKDSKTVLYLPGMRPRTPLHKELRVFLEEEQKASEAGLSANEEQNQEDKEEEPDRLLVDSIREEKLEDHDKSVALEHENSIEQKLQKLEIKEGKENYGISVPVIRDAETEEDDDEVEEERRQERGKGNVEKWLQILLENSQDIDPLETHRKDTEEIIRQINQKYPQKEMKISKVSDPENNEDRTVHTGNKICNGEEAACICEENVNASFDGMERKEYLKKGKGLVRSESARTLRRIGSSPSLLLGMRKKKQTLGSDDNVNEDHSAANSFIWSSIKTIKKAVKI